MIKNKCYAAGLVNRKDNWEWQGTVVAQNQKVARKMVLQYKKENQLSGRVEVASIMECISSQNPGVYDSTELR